MKVIAAAAGVVLLLAGCTGEGGVPSQYQPYPPSVSVTGVGTATGTADMAVITFSVDVTGEDAGEAVNEATALAQGSIAAAEGAGVSEEDIETLGYSIYMEEEYDYETYEYTGRNLFHLTHSFKVSLRDIDAAGDVLAALVEGGATTVNGIQFTMSNREELIAEARSIAIENARITAEQLAEGLGVSLGSPMNVSEWVDYYGSSDPYRQSYDSAGYYDAPPVSSGNTSITMNVSVSYLID